MLHISLLVVSYNKAHQPHPFPTSFSPRFQIILTDLPFPFHTQQLVDPLARPTQPWIPASWPLSQPRLRLRPRSSLLSSLSPRSLVPFSSDALRFPQRGYSLATSRRCFSFCFSKHQKVTHSPFFLISRFLVPVVHLLFFLPVGCLSKKFLSFFSFTESCLIRQK